MQFNKRLGQAGDSYFETKKYVKIYKKNVIVQIIQTPMYDIRVIFGSSGVYFVNESFVFLSVVQDDVLTD